ncbi:MAG: hypothetical protein U1D55_12165 [Phycisphaerae bacterium]
MRVFLLALLISSVAVADQIPAARASEILRQALDAYDAAVESAQRDPAGAAEHYQSAARGFEALREGGVQNPWLEYDLGNTYFRMGKLGNAIAAYRRAERLAPREPRILANLEYARRRVEPPLAQDQSSGVLRRLLFWHFGTSQTERFWTCAIAGVAGWSLLLIALRRPGAPIRVAATAGILVSLACGASVFLQIQDQAAQPHAVIVSGLATLRNGRGEGYEAVLKEPLGAGVELRILQTRGDWSEVRIPGGTTGWLPSAAIELV